MNAAVVLLTLGLLLIYFELNRPGTILPGAVGLLATLLAIAHIAQRGPSTVGVVMVFSAVALLAVDLLRPTPVAVSFTATLALGLGLWLLPGRKGTEIVALPVVLVCALLLGGGTSVLTRVARRARANKAL